MTSCFPRRTPSLSSSDRTGMAASRAIYNNISQNIDKGIPQKVANKPGSVNYRLCPGKRTGVITGAMSTETRLRVARGQFLCKPCCPDRYFSQDPILGNALLVQDCDEIVRDNSVQAYRPERQAPPTWMTKSLTNGFISIPSSIHSGEQESSGCVNTVWHGYEHVIAPAPSPYLRTTCSALNGSWRNKVRCANPALAETTDKGTTSRLLNGFVPGPMKYVSL